MESGLLNILLAIAMAEVKPRAKEMGWGLAAQPLLFQGRLSNLLLPSAVAWHSVSQGKLLRG